MQKPYIFPERTKPEKPQNIPKSKLYPQAKVTAREKKIFADEVDKITLKYQLSRETLNLAPTSLVPLINVIHIKLITGGLSSEVLHVLDRSLPSPTFYIIESEHRFCYAAAYKRPHLNDSTKAIFGKHYFSTWFAHGTPPQALPLALNLEGLYEKLLEPLLLLGRRPQETFANCLERNEQHAQLTAEADKLRAKMAKEQQFNRKVELNSQLNHILRELQRLA